MTGWRGRVLHVDLQRRRWRVESVDRAILRAVLGGRGLAGWLLASAPEPPLVFVAGPLTAGVLPMAGRAVIAAVSPLTGTVRHAPAGGRLAAALLRAGLDAVCLTGRADAPVTLHIGEGSVEFADAAPLQGLETSHRLNALRAPRRAVVCVGPAAEAGSPLGCLLQEHGRPVPGGGLGLAMAGRNLLAVTVDGRQPTAVHDPESLRRMRRVFLRLIHASPALAGASGIGRHGDGAFFDLFAARHLLLSPSPCASHAAAAEPLGALAYAAGIVPGHVGCTACPVPCGRTVHGQPLPDLAAMAGFSVRIGGGSRALAVRAFHRCLVLGLDAGEAAAAVADHLDAVGLSCPEDVVPELLEGLGRGEGLVSSPEAGMRVKGMALPCMDPRGAWGLALALAVGVQGPLPDACVVWHQEILRKPVPVDRFSWSGKARLVARGEDAAAVAQSLGVCSLALAALGMEELAQALAAVTGWNVSAGDLAAAGAALVEQDRRLHCAAGFDAAQDDLPPQCFEAPAGDGSIPPLDRRAFLEERAKYYRIRGWSASGCPAGAIANRPNKQGGRHA
ncbi:aldehyde ferredoxin oxidoreductase N-terminal domain-containing protein [Megalodesulfovibrio gigas]|uniref:Putative aldehyde ferredoxin oxidoreductase n=1 Tax=Megalodesulfovibrio gigas (strain ATCC 19364 / DSM 1382 / NCIMB 9332 / VKM B-1759) TaxID=1121448 RepID=T2GAY5_MEGG1|nr:aldehyde ferredoxin oxidoreductase N-terminal domain-containing protein [Megalodesulfovibrio gigas]AGW13291.1 putative aldehyde ferredoxin oxidoreductase [Megalodesulfovibrio gigas DSM 1382 = ATCC 19364]